MKNKKQLGIYIHIPFCVHKCIYCDFLSGPSDSKTQKMYIDALLSEIDYTADKMGKTLTEDYKVKSVFFGGGTPSVIDSLDICRIMDRIYKNFDVAENAEISIECNPGTLSSDKAKIYLDAGINRISFGLQSASDSELKMLGRIHTYDKFLESLEMARAAGFTNINADIMSALPGQTLKSYMDTLCKIVRLDLQHVSAYSLIIEDNTYLADNIVNYPPVPDEDEEREMYYQTIKILTENGYEHYEISNFAKLGKECIHNLSYWERKDYLGFGLGAASLFNEERYVNISDLEKYINQAGKNDIRLERHTLKADEQMEEFMFLGLRKIKGVDAYEFKNTFGCDINEIYGKVIEKNIKDGLLLRQDNMIKLTRRGVDISNVVMSDFLL